MQETIEYIKQAFELKSQQCYKQAIEMLYKALELENDNLEILFQLGELYYLLKNFQRAVGYLEKVLAKNSSHIESLNILKQIHIFQNEYKEAYKMAERIYNIQKTTDNLSELIKISAKQGDIDKIKSFEKSDIADGNVIYNCAKAYYENARLEDAKKALKKALEIDADNEDALVLSGKIYFDESEFEKSKEIFNRFSKTSENPEILNYLGLFALEDMKFIDAIKYFSKASAINKQNHKYFYNLANAYFYNGWFDEASKAYLQAICLAPDIVDYRYSLAYLYFEDKKYDKAQKEVDYIFSIDKNHPQTKVLNALLKFENKDFLGAQSELESNVKSGIEDNFTLVSLSKVYSELGLYEKAEDMVKKVIANNPESLNYNCKLAEVYIAEKKYEEAVKLVQEVIDKNENFIAAYIIGAKACYETGDLEHTKLFAQEAISLDMNYAQGYYYLALVRFAEKDYDEAIECMKRAIMFDVNNAAYYAKMSEIYKAVEDYKTALEYIKEAESISGSTEYKIMFTELAGLNRKSK